MMTRSFQLTVTAVLASAFFAPLAIADLGGGGATLPARAYQGTSASADASGPRLSSPAAGSLFAVAVPGVAQTYCQTGSGAGRAVLTSASGNTDDRLDCPATFTDAFVNGVNGFSAPLADASFAASDAPAGGTDFTSYVTNEGAQHTQLTQFPSLVGNVAVIYHNSSIRKTVNVLLTEAELCNVWSGRITNWNQLVNPKGQPFGAKPIKLVYRSDSSGTSFGFSNHLNWVCQDATLNENLVDTAAPLPFAVGDNFSVNSTFATAFPVNTGAPAGSLSASGNPGVISTVDSNDGAIGYAEAANLLAVGTSSPNVRISHVAALDTNELDPQAPNTPRAAKRYRDPTLNTQLFTLPATFVDKDGGTYSSAYTDRSLQANNVTFGRPVGLGTALTADQAPVPNCVYLVQPGAYATSTYNTSGDPATGYKFYPIGVVTYLMSNQSGNPAFKQLRSLLGSPYNRNLRASVTSVGTNTGYSYLAGVQATPLSNGAKLGLNQTRINACTVR